VGASSDDLCVGIFEEYPDNCPETYSPFCMSNKFAYNNRCHMCLSVAGLGQNGGKKVTITVNHCGWWDTCK